MNIYRFTSGVHAVAASSPWDTARTGVTQETIPTTRLGIYDAFAAGLEAAGLTRFDRKLAGAAPSHANRDDVWFSTGESGKKNIVFRTASHAHSGAPTSQYLTVIVAPKRDDAATALSGTWTWDGTTTVLSTNTSQVRVGSFIKANTDGQWFQVASIVVNTSVVVTTGGFTIPTGGALASSVLTPNLEADVGNAALTGTTAPFDTSVYRWDLGGADFNADFQLTATKDHVWFVVQNVAHTGTMFVAHVSDLIPLDVNPNVMNLASSVVAGEFKELITVDEAGASVNPITLGYRELDRVQILEVDPLSTPKAETQVIVRVLSDRIVVRNLRFAYQGRNFGVNPQRYGARIGMAPSNIVFNLGGNDEIEENTVPSQSSNNARLTTYFDTLVDNVPPNNTTRTQGDLVSSPTAKVGETTTFLHYAQRTTHAQTNTEYGTATTPNARTLRFTMRTLAIGAFGATHGHAFIGKIPGILSYNGTISFYPHDNCLHDRVSPNKDYVPFRFTASSARNYVLGPTPGP